MHLFPWARLLEGLCLIRDWLESPNLEFVLFILFINVIIASDNVPVADPGSNQHAHGRTNSEDRIERL